MKGQVLVQEPPWEGKHDIPGRRRRMRLALNGSAPHSIIRQEAWMLVYAYAGDRWPAVWWCFKQALSHTLNSLRDRLFPPKEWAE